MRIIIGMMMMSDHLRGHGALPLAAPLIWHGLRHMAYGIAWGIAWGMAQSIAWGIWPTAYVAYGIAYGIASQDTLPFDHLVKSHFFKFDFFVKTRLGFEH